MTQRQETPPEPPSLQSLVQAWGGYDKIPDHAWEQFQYDRQAYLRWHRNAHFDPNYRRGTQ